MGLEPTTATLARWRSTTELRSLPKLGVHYHIPHPMQHFFSAMFSAHVFCRAHLCFFPRPLFGFVPPLFDCKARGGASRPRRAGMEDEPGNGKAWSERLGENAFAQHCTSYGNMQGWNTPFAKTGDATENGEMGKNGLHGGKLKSMVGHVLRWQACATGACRSGTQCCNTKKQTVAGDKRKEASICSFGGPRGRGCGAG